MKTAILVLTLISGFSVGAAEKVVEVENKAYWLCKIKKDVRTIRVHIGKDGMCYTHYSKGGAEKMVGTARHLESCMSFLQNIKANLEKSNWSCKDITATKISDSAE